MNPAYRRDWLLFAFILWFGLGVAHGKLLLVFAAILAALAVIVPARRRPADPIRVTPHHDDEQGLNV